MFKVVAFAIIALLAVLILKNQRGEYAMLISAAAGALILITVIGWVYTPLNELAQKLYSYGTPTYLVKYLFKIFAVCYITKFASELCEDFGQTSLSGKIDLAGRGTVFLLTIPLLNRVLEIAAALIG